ncbi:MAG: DUF3788 domain-containing protein [Terriglobia bacterium]
MALSIFDDKSREPKDTNIADALGRTKRFWDDLKDHLAQRLGTLSEEWKFYGKESGWTLRMKRKRRTILYLVPRKGSFIVVFVFGERAVEAARKSTLPRSILAIINDATRYVEGRSFRVGVRRKKDLDSIKELVAIKMAN